VSAFIDEQRGRFGVEPICRVLDVSASAHYQRKTGTRSARAVEDERLLGRIRELHAVNYYAYGSRRMWKVLKRAGESPGRGRVERLMRGDGICGAKRRGKPWRTTRPDPLARRRPDLVDRDFSAQGPNELWVADLTYLRCWQGVVFFAFIIDAYSRRVVGWQFAGHMRTTLVLDALRMALHQRGPSANVELVHHSDRGSQGEFNRSSQRSSERSCDGREATGSGSGREAGDALAGASAGREAGASSAVLGGDCARAVERGCCGAGRRVAGRGRPVVSGGWRDAVRHAGPGVGAVPVVCRAGGDRSSARPRRRGHGDRASARPLAVDDLEGTAAQRRDSRRRARVPGHDRPVAR
jgi:putative transposase